MSRTSKMKKSNLVLVIALTFISSACSNQNKDEEKSDDIGESISNAVSNVINEPKKSCSVEFTKPYAQSAIYSEFKDKDETFVGMAKEFEKIFTYSQETLSILSMSDFDNQTNACLLDNKKIVLVDSSDECSDMRSRVKEDGSLYYQNVKSLENITTRFQEYIVLSESSENGKDVCEIKFKAIQQGSSNIPFSRSTPWIDLTLYIYDQKTSDGNYYFEYVFPGLQKYAQNNNNQIYYAPARGRDLRTNVTGTGVRE